MFYIKNERCSFLFWYFNRRHSDDPLISGALDDNQNEFDSIAGCGTALTSIEASPSTYNKKARVRKSGNIKLRFHHQALPQEYLEHYEATQNQFHSKEMTLGSGGKSSRKDRTATTTIPSPVAPSQELASNEHESTDLNSEKSTQIWMPKASKHQNGRESHTRIENELKSTPKQNAKVHDLPYMGELTLDNFKPRRGRKPKKADICHLIYKNYGTVFPNQKASAAADDETEMEIDASTNNNNNTEAALKRSLLERRLTQSGDAAEESLNHDAAKDSCNGEEPLNLCVRDRYDSDVMTVISDEDMTDSEKLSDFKAEMGLLAANDPLSAANFPRNLKMALPNFQTALLENKHELPESGGGGGNSGVGGIDMETNDINSCWQSSGMFLNPMVLYLQKIANVNVNSNAHTTSNYGQRLSNESPKAETTETIDTNPSRTRQKRMLVPKKMSQLLKEDSMASDAGQLSSPIAMASSSNKTSSSSSAAASMLQGNQKNPNAPKRKRSAIFIPPVPDESSTNHATEVSICKFKFTGGAKPSLQEKKMLSVDAGGNFRFYSGTGDKSIRGYEFFPRESLKQSSLVSASSAGAFLNTTGQKIPNDIPPPSFGLSNELLQIPEMSTPSSVGILSSSQNAIPSSHAKAHYHSNRSKRKSKRSMQREKLEKTFKEKGFLIQTQQLEQAEGTYCKFRQLRKFTRYLFRSWKDYLPGELQQNQANPALNQASTSAIVDQNGMADASATHFMPPSPSSSHDNLE